MSMFVTESMTGRLAATGHRCRVVTVRLRACPVLENVLLLQEASQARKYCAAIRHSLACGASVRPTDCILTFSLGLFVPTLRRFCRLRSTIWYDMIWTCSAYRNVTVSRRIRGTPVADSAEQLNAPPERGHVVMLSWKVKTKMSRCSRRTLRGKRKW